MANFAVTLPGARISPLIKPERNALGTSVRYLVLSSDVAVASATGNADTITVTLGTTPINWCVSSAFAYVQTAFAGTTALTMIVGTTSSTAAFLASTSVLTAGIIQPTTGINTTASIANSIGTSSVTVQAVFTNATGGSPSALTAGLLEIVLNYVNMDQLY
jgi:hypothetical protein